MKRKIIYYKNNQANSQEFCFKTKKEAIEQAKEKLAGLEKEKGATYSFKIFKIKKTFASTKKFFAKINENFQKMFDYLEFDMNDTINEDNFKKLDQENAFDSLQELLEDNQAFDIEIITHYYNAIEYLAKNDPSLRYSLELAQELGFELKNLNSKTLASLLASEIARITRFEFKELEEEIKEFFNN